jgi:hypothetical protein
MTESDVLNEWIEEAVRGRALADARRFLIRLLEGRFPGQVSQEVLSTINQQPSLPMLEDWFDQANRAAAFADFLRVLRA